MVIFDLICEHNHQFEGWFKSNEDLNEQISSGLLVCPVCASVAVTKKLTAAKIGRKSNSENIKSDLKNEVLKLPENYSDIQSMLRKVHEHVEKNFKDVGSDFTEQAISMHNGEVAKQNIRGTATMGQIRELSDEGVQALPLPPKPLDKDKLN